MASSNFPRIPDSEFVDRVNRLQQKMKNEKIDMVIAHSMNYIEPSVVRYLSDFFPVNENGAIIVYQDGEPLVISGQASHSWSKYTSRFKNVRVLPEVGEVSGVEYDIDLTDFESLFKEIKAEKEIKKIVWIGELTFPVVIYEKMKRVFPEAEVYNDDDLVYDMRQSKSENELECMRKAGEILTECFQYAVPRIKVGLTELDIQADLEGMMFRLGAEDHCLSWAPETPVGKDHTNLCVSRNFRRDVREGEIINVNAGVLYEGYNSAICTPVVLGKIPDEIRKAVLVGWEAEKVVEDVLRPGVSSRKLAQVYGDFLTEKGYRQFSPYGAVHSTGMLECERPFFSAKRDVYLQENSTVCIDVYFDSMPWGSFRIEDTYIVKSSGLEKVTKFNEEYLKTFK